MADPFPDANWRSCYDQLAPKLLLFARQWLASVADAEDVVQTAFVRFWRHHPDAAPEHYPLLYAAVRTTALDHLRSIERRCRRESDDRVEVLRDDRPWFDAPSAMENRENADDLQNALQMVPREQREVIVLKIWGELTFAQIAQTLDESINTVASRYRYGLDALRRYIKPRDYERV